MHPRSISLLAYPLAVYTRSISLLTYPAVVYTGSVIGLVYPAVVHTRSLSLLVYPAVVYTHVKIYITTSVPSSCIHWQCYWSIVPSDCPHKIYITGSVANNSKDFTVYPISHYPRQYTLNCCALDISTFYSILNRSVSKAL